MSKFPTGPKIFFSLPVFFFILNYLLKVTSLNNFKIFYGLVLLLVLFYPVIYFTQIKINNFFTKKIYLFAVLLSIFWGVMAVFLLLTTLINSFLVFENLKWTLGLSLLFMLISLVQSQQYTIKKVKIISPKIKNDKTLVQISDTHFYGGDANIAVKQLVKKIRKLNPDFVFITGDLLDNYGVPPIDSLKYFNKINVPIYFVYGNHENILLPKIASKILSLSKIKPLINTSVTFGDLQIIGIDDDSKVNMKLNLENQKVKNNKFSILLQHKPINENIAADKKIDLMLSGHWHGGQLFPLNLFLNLLIKYMSGTYKVKKMYFHISKGTGTRSFPIRFGFSNEITMIKLKPKV